MRIPGIRNVVAGTLVAILFAAGCASSPAVEFYTLSALSSPSAAGQPVAIAVGPAEFPRALVRSQILTRNSANHVTYDDYNRWAGALETDFLRVTGTNLSRLLGTDRVVVYPTPASFPLDYRVTFDVQRFDSDANGNVTLSTRWSLMDGKSGEVLEFDHFETTRSATADDFESRAAAHSAVLAQLCEEIAGRMRTRTAGS